MPEKHQMSVGFSLSLIGLFLIGPLALTIFIPALPIIQHIFEAEVQAVQLNLSLPMLAVVLVPVVIGVSADRVGRKNMIMTGLVVTCAGCVIVLMADSIFQVVVGRVIVGVASTAILVLGRAVVVDTYEGKDLSKVVARYSIVPVVAIFIGPTLGGLIVDHLSWQSVFYVLLGLSVFITLVTYKWLPDTKPRSSDATTNTVTPPTSKTLLKIPAFWGYIFQSALHFAGAFSLVAAGPYLMVNVLGKSATDFGIAMLFVIMSMLIGVLVSGRTIDKLSISLQVFLGSLISGVAAVVFLVLLFLPNAEPSVMMIFVPACFTALGIGFSFPPCQVGYSSMITELSATASGIASGLQMLMAAAVSHIVTMQWFSPELNLGVVSIVLFGAAVLFSVIPLLTGRKKITI